MTPASPTVRLAAVTLVALVALLSGCDQPDRQPLDIVAEEICTTGSTACARMADGTVLCWGSHGVAIRDAGATRLQCGIAVCIETEDQTITCYNGRLEPVDSDADQPDPAALPLTDWWEAKYRNQVHGCGLTMDGSLSCWGYDPYVDSFESALSDLSVRQVAFTDACHLVLDDAGRIHSVLSGENCAGYKEWHHLDDDETTYRWFLDYPPVGPGFAQISGGRDHACAIGSEGGVACFGSTYQLAPPAGVRFTQLDSSDHTSCGITTDSTIACWSGRPNDYEWMPPTTPGWKQVVIDGWEPDSFSQPDVYINMSWALSQTGQVVSIGDQPSGWSTYDDAVMEWVGL